MGRAGAGRQQGMKEKDEPEEGEEVKEMVD